jgi:hypothetical protein
MPLDEHFITLDSKSNPVMQCTLCNTHDRNRRSLQARDKAFVLLYSTVYKLCMFSNLETRVYHRVPCMYGGGTTC